jgi:hypothetical protein
MSDLNTEDGLINLYTRIINENTRIMYSMYNDFVGRARQNENMLVNLISREINYNRISSNIIPNRTTETTENNTTTVNYSDMVREMRHTSNNYRNTLRNNVRNQINTNRTNDYRHGNIRQSTGIVNNVSHNEIPATNNSIDNVLNNFDNLISSSLDELFEPVIVRPTERQIRIATQRTTFNDIIRPVNTRCPISLAEFQSDSDVIMISYCRHLFCPNDILNWFRSNVRCPICRYDIREYSRPLYVHNLGVNTTETDNSNEIVTSRENADLESNNHENTEHAENDDDSSDISNESEISVSQTDHLLNSSLTNELYNDLFLENNDNFENNDPESN